MGAVPRGRVRRLRAGGARRGCVDGGRVRARGEGALRGKGLSDKIRRIMVDATDITLEHIAAILEVSATEGATDAE